MQLVIFDIDGTLTDTVRVDSECFVRSFTDVFRFTDIDTDWSKYRHATDAGILYEVYLSRVGSPPPPSDAKRFRDHFVELLTQASNECHFAAVLGAAALLARLRFGDKTRVSLATGGWSDSARLKMASAGMCYDDYPSASSDDAREKQSIIQLSMQRASQWHGQDFSRVVYVGDAVWDAHACRSLAIPFIGIAPNAAAEKLVQEGAVRVFRDYSDVDRCLSSLSAIV